MNSQTFHPKFTILTEEKAAPLKMAKKENVKVTKVETVYKGFEISVSREPSLGGEELLYYSIFREWDGLEVYFSFSSGEDSLFSMVEHLKGHVDDYLENPEEYDD